MDVALNLDYLRPGARYTGSLTANTPDAYAAIVWQDERTQPTWVEIEAVEIVPPLADRLKEFLLESLETHKDVIDPYTEMKIRQLQKTLEPLPVDMETARFAAAVRTEIENFPLPDNEILQGIRNAMLEMIDNA